MKTFKQFILEYSLTNRPFGKKGKRSDTSLISMTGDNVIHRVDHPRTKPTSTEYSTNDPSRRNNRPDTPVSGRDTSRRVQSQEPGMTKIKGTYADHLATVSQYAIPRKASFAQGGNGRLYVDKGSNNFNNKVKVSAYKADKFHQLPGGEHFSHKPGKPLATKEISAKELLRQTGRTVKQVNLKALVKRARRRGISVTGENLPEED